MERRATEELIARLVRHGWEPIDGDGHAFLTYEEWARLVRWAETLGPVEVLAQQTSLL